MNVNVLLNGVHRRTQAVTLHELLSEQEIETAGLAVAIGMRVIRRDQWEDTLLCEGMEITLIRATQGG